MEIVNLHYEKALGDGTPAAEMFGNATKVDPAASEATEARESTVTYGFVGKVALQV